MGNTQLCVSRQGISCIATSFARFYIIAIFALACNRKNPNRKTVKAACAPGPALLVFFASDTECDTGTHCFISVSVHFFWDK